MQQTGLNALHLSSKEGHVDIVKTLLAAGMPVHSTTKVMHLKISRRYSLIGVIITLCDILLRPGRGAEYCDRLVCESLFVPVCLFVREHLSGTTGPIFTKLFVQTPCGRGSVILQRRCDTLCTSGFMDDVTFGRMGRMAMPYRGGVEFDAYECLVCNYFRLLQI